MNEHDGKEYTVALSYRAFVMNVTATGLADQL